LIKIVIKLLIMLAVLNAAFRGGLAAWGHYELKDAAHQLILFGANVPTNQISYLILDKAMELEVPLEPGNIDVTREGNRTTVSASYTKPIEFFPNFTYPIDLSFTVESFSLSPSNVQ
jgi:hypothetical protein